ncbi:phage baseplate protein [Megamonas funiformis]|uniref:phage baseplate protein n=1 Tax=Megamonas funiformis TaxID=437897 RepID=UPI0022E7EA6A|nr:hypothetical protein [Megamonas funiformis]
MAFNEEFPKDDSYIADFPVGEREQNRALKDDQIVNAGQLQGLTTGNANGQIPINNGTENTNLNAALLNGKASSYFATSNHTHDVATQSSNGYMSNADKKKLDGIASGAEVNQNAFANVKVGTTTIQADAKQDTLTLAAGANISLVGDANNDKVTIAVTGKVASASQADSATNATNATKATQDSAGQTINTTYVKGVSANNATLTITKGNGSTSTTTINNVSNANNLVISGTSAHIKYGGGDVDENTAISQNKVNLLIGSWFSTGFRDLCSSGTPIRVAINHRNGNIKTTGNVTANGAMYSATPATTDNSTRVATTAYVKNNISETLKKVYPVGSIYMSTVSTNPATLFGFGTWEAMPAGRVLLAQGKSSWGTTYNAGSTGGEATHTLTVGEIPSHNHTASTNTTGNHHHGTVWTEGSYNVWGLYNSSTNHRGMGAGNDYDNALPNTSTDGNHSHTVTINYTGSNQPHNNLQPYCVCYIWKRTA